MAKETYMVESDTYLESDDGKMGLIAYVGGNEDDPFEVRIHSWDENGEHPIVERLRGCRVRVTVEVVQRHSDG